MVIRNNYPDGCFQFSKKSRVTIIRTVISIAPYLTDKGERTALYKVAKMYTFSPKETFSALLQIQPKKKT